jgi:sugar lactone lactonase YvrE
MTGRCRTDRGQDNSERKQVRIGSGTSRLSTYSVLCTLSLILAPCLGSVWTTDGTDSLLQQLDRIEFENVSIHRRGTTTLAPALAAMTLDDAAAVWQTADDRSENVYVATGNQGRLYRLRPASLLRRSSSPELVFDSGSGEILALTSDAAGTIYFGTTPDGKVYRIRPGGKPELLCSTGETYVHGIIAAPPSTSAPGTIYAATGEHGRLLRISSTGKASEVFTARQAHLTALTWLVPGKELLVGSSPDGIVYRLSFAAGGERPRVSVLYDTPLNEVRAIAADAAGSVYIGANAGEDTDSDSSRACVYYIDNSGVRRWQWSAPDSTVFALALTESPNPAALLVATGGKAMVYELDTLGRMSVRYRLKETQALCITPLRSGIRLGTGNPGKLYEAGSNYADSGFITSSPYDCANPALFGNLSFRADVPAGTELAFDTRSGNSEKPDSTWSEWTQATARIASPSRRYIQWRCRMRTSFPNRTPELGRVDVYFRTANLAPVIKKLDIAQPSLDDAVKGVNKPSRQVTWEATDPDSDSLSFELFFRDEPENSWQKVGRDITDNRYELDSRSLPDGWYELKLVASDEPTEPAGIALTAERVSRPFLVDNTAPAVAGLEAGTPDPKTGLSRVTFSAQDALSPIAAARVSVNAGDWMTLEPRDHIFDSVTESFSTDVKLAPGENVVSVWVADAQGNVGAARTTVLAPK